MYITSHIYTHMHIILPMSVHSSWSQHLLRGSFLMFWDIDRSFILSLNDANIDVIRTSLEACHHVMRLFDITCTITARGMLSHLIMIKFN